MAEALSCSTPSGIAPQALRYSFFDVFDTLIVRTWARPSDLFCEAEEELRRQGLIASAPGEFVTARIACERVTRRDSPSRECTLRGIYAQLRTHFNWSDFLTAQALDLEVQLEWKSHRSNPSMANLLAQHRMAGLRIVFISDMYLSADVITASLRRLGLWVEGDRLFVSGEIGLAKRTGELFQHVLTQLGITPNQAVHVGDNRISDYQMPKRLGIWATRYDGSALSHYERIIDEVPGAHRRVRSKLAAAMRLARLSSHAATATQQTIWHTGTNVIGPLLFSFVAWCLLRAREQGISRLYFLARDGQILLRIARALGGEWTQGLDCRYLFASRQAWFPAAVSVASPDSLDWALSSESSRVTLATVANRLGVEVDQLSAAFTRYGGRKYRDHLNAAELTALRHALTSPELVAVVAGRATQARELLLGYMHQEGLTDTQRWAIVDVGWKGRLQQCLSTILRQAKQQPLAGVHGFYFGLVRQPAFEAPDRFEAFFFGPETQSAKRRRFCPPALIEQFTEADHGTTTGFARAGGRVVPVLLEQSNVRALAWGLPYQHEAICTFAREIGQILSPGEVAAVIRDGIWPEFCARLMAAFYYRPLANEAEVYGSFAKDSELEHAEHQELAPRLSTMQTLQLVAAGPRRSAPQRKPVMWVGGSLIRSGHPWATSVYEWRHRLANFLS